MIYLKLFINFLIIGTLSFGGGYGMISLMREIVLSNHWLSEDMFMSFVAVAESTPGPLAVNLATFVGSSQGGFLGAFFATLGVVLPAFVIILLIAAILKNLMKYSGTKAFLSGVRPCVVAMILATAIIMGLSTLFNFKSIDNSFSINYRYALIFVILIAVHFLSKYLFKKTLSPILMILFSAVLGIVFC